MASTAKQDNPPPPFMVRKRAHTDEMLDSELGSLPKMLMDDPAVFSDPGTPLCIDGVDSPIQLREVLLSTLRSYKEFSTLGETELELLAVVSFMKQNILPEQFLLKFMGDEVTIETKIALNNLKLCRLLQQQEVGKSWIISNMHQEKIKNLISKCEDGDKIKIDLLERAIKELISELSNRKEGNFPYSSYIQDLIVTGIEIWENVFQYKDLVAKYFENLNDFTVASYEEMNTTSASVLFCTKTIRHLCRHFGQNDAKALSMKMCLASIQAKNGKSEQALFDLEDNAELMENSDDSLVRALLVRALEKKAFILKNEEKNCDKALGICEKILKLDKKKYAVDSVKILEVKLFKCRILNSAGQFALALDICDEILTETKNIESLQNLAVNVKFARVEIFMSMEKNDLALSAIDEIISARVNLFGQEHSSVLEARIQKARILEDMKQLDQALEELYAILKIYEDKFGINHVKTLNTKECIARVLACKGQRVEATELLNLLLDSYTLLYGSGSKEVTEFLDFKAHILRVNAVTHSSQGAPDSFRNAARQLSFQESLNIYGELKKYYITKYDLSNFETNEGIEKVVLKHSLEGNWNATLADAQWIFDKIKDELGENHQGLEYPLSLMADSYFHLEDPANELRCRETLYKVRMLNYGESNIDTLNTLIRVAKLQVDLKRLPNALVSYENIYKLSVIAYGETHEESINSLDKIAELQLQLLMYDDALQNFEKVSTLIRKETVQAYEDIRLKTKYNIALCHLKLSNVEEARSLSKDLYDEACWTFGEENQEYLNLYEFCQSIYERQKRSWGRYGKFGKSFTSYNFERSFP